MGEEELEVLERTITRAVAKAIKEHNNCQAFTEAERVMIKTLAAAYSNSTNFLWRTVIKAILALAAVGALITVSWKTISDKLGG